ncbi:putative hexosyltransferase MUCI70 [Cardamine amara subsp. amara]|uniref:Hexosyltransferase MUCI70 n=1 Tax=Cardamine amara subsp. amara TaxID=228776 RepID=A0ABD0ZA77_CARAN
MLPERRSTVASSSYQNPSGQNDSNSLLFLRRGKKFGRIVKLKLSHFVFFFLSLFFFSCIFSGHKLLFHGSELLPHFEQNPYMNNHMEIDIGLNKSNIEKPPGSKKRNKHLPCEVALGESVDRILEPQDYLNFTRFSLGFVETQTHNKPRFGGHQTLNERERSYSAINQTIHCGFVKGFHQGTGFDLSETDRAYMKNCVISVSSCIFGSSDFLRRPASKKISEFSKRNVCFVMFVDEQTLVKLASEGHVPDKQGFVGLWKTVVVSNLPYTDMRKTGKVPKFLSHRLFPSSRYSIWIDSKMRLTTDPIQIIDFFLWRTKSEFAISNHYDRHCVWDEVLQNKRLNKYNHSAIDEQFMFYRSDGLKKFNPSDPNSPLPSYVPEGSFIVRAHTPMSNLFTCLWFNEVDRFTSRDQLSFAYTYLKLQRMNPDRPLRLNMFKDCERRALTKLFHHRVDSSPPA